jgi:cytochrome c oxidase subunit II
MMNLFPPLFADSSFWLGPAASTSAQRHDSVFYTVLYVTGFFFCLVVGLMLLFIVLYRRRREQAPANVPTHNTLLEVTWTSIPLAVVTGFFVLGFRAFLDFDTPPPNAAVVEVSARQWGFTFTYPNGAVSDALYLRVNEPVVLQLTSQDVLHSFYVPAFRVQRNAVPRRTVTMWVKPTVLGTFHAFCTQYCGDGHSLMTADVLVMDDAAYRAKLAALANIFVDRVTKKPRPYAAVGEELYHINGCYQCHTIDKEGTPANGPTWRGLYKRDHQFSETDKPGYTLTAADPDDKWEAYLTEHILTPGRKVVQGFQKGVMPSYETQFSGSATKEKKLKAILEFIKSLGPGGEVKSQK